MIIAHKLLSSLEKVFPDEAPDAASHAAASALQGETPSAFSGPPAPMRETGWM